MRRPFYRIGQPVRIPVSPQTANTPFDMKGKIPENADAFMVVNVNGFDVRLEGTPAGEAFKPVGPQNLGWIFPRDRVMGPFTTKRPIAISAVAVGRPGQPLSTDPVQYQGAVIELIYGSVG